MFNGARRLRFQGLDLVVLPRAGEHRSQLDAQRDALLKLATLARGWGSEEVPRMREVFKLEPFHRATSLVLVFDQGRLCGTGGVDANFAECPPDVTILHLCSLNLLDEQKRTGLAALFMLLLGEELLAPLPAHRPVYFTSISQSPLVYRLLTRLAKVYPDGRSTPPDDVREVARVVAARYDPHIPLDADRLVLRNECDFFYRQVPYVADSRVNALFDSELDIAAGDVFVNVGKTDAGSARAAVERYRGRFPKMPEAHSDG
ncbi:hypothetical protein NKJ23_13795 [Mesorhizobium sp. M0184]|uniref:hypothetical protein n=1 Tax=Mesorhizobium sp. M0184 TaxID=2956906 RepID=UPI00333ABC90